MQTAPIATQQLIYINNSVSEANTAVVPVQSNTALYLYYFKTISFIDVTGALILPLSLNQCIKRIVPFIKLIEM
ncbi:hypothetical protein XELAEV_18009766mg [Xenopus laevis]|uniref:Uncharacterized protein n=1 Tax=Xenopus laevis TaxID=8355 RepID=A0A974DTA6_XENLA|nr:hypothetical protein XELAEV_18009766mg [Xenopus laevis]